jgi:hypothetical protein
MSFGMALETDKEKDQRPLIGVTFKVIRTESGFFLVSRQEDKSHPFSPTITAITVQRSFFVFLFQEKTLKTLQRQEPGTICIASAKGCLTNCPFALHPLIVCWPCNARTSS